MDFFKKLDGAVLLHRNGVFRQAEIYSRGTQIYARANGGYILLAGYSATSDPRTTWREISSLDVVTGQNKAPVLAG